MPQGGESRKSQFSGAQVSGIPQEAEAGLSACRSLRCCETMASVTPPVALGSQSTTGPRRRRCSALRSWRRRALRSSGCMPSWRFKAPRSGMG